MSFCGVQRLGFAEPPLLFDPEALETRMPIKDDYYIEMWKQVLSLSRLKADERVVVLTTEGSRPVNVDAAQRSAMAMGASMFRLELPPMPPRGLAGVPVKGITPLSSNKLAVETLKQADLVIDLIGLLHSPEQTEILAAGTRMLMVIEPPEILAQMLPSLDDKRRVMEANRKLKSAKTMHVTSQAGTDLTMQLGAYATLPEYGFADDPGHWDHWPSGFLATWPKDNTANGRVVIDIGDMLFPMQMYVMSPITLEIENGFIRKIEGGFEAAYLRRHIDNYMDPLAYAVSHVGWGMQPKAKWTGLGMRDKSGGIGMDARSFEGNFLFSTGPNGEGGGSNHSACHVDIPMAGCSVSLDGMPITRDGVIVDRDLVAAG